MNIALTGGSGFVGRYLIAELTTAGHHVRSLTRTAKRRREQKSIQWIVGDLRGDDTAPRLLDGCQALVHAGLDRGEDNFQDHPHDPIDYFQANVIGSLRLIEEACRQGSERLVFVSSGAVHQRVLADRELDETHPLWPASLYGSAKASTETLIHAYGFSERLSACTLRPTAIYGVDEPIENSKWWNLVRDVAMGKQVHATGGSKYVHAADVAKAVRLLLSTDSPTVQGQTFNCSDRMISHHEVATIAKEISRSDATILGTPKAAKNTINTDKLQSLGLEFGGTHLLTTTIKQMVAAINVSET